MKRIAVLLFLMCAVMAWSQEASPARPTVGMAPTYSDLYCAGFVAPAASVQALGYVEGGADTPHTTRYADREFIFLNGSNFQVGQRYTLIRELRDANKYEAYKDQYKVVDRVGQPFADLGYATVTALRGPVAVARIDFSCDTILPGDLAVAFQERQPVSFRPTTFDRFPGDDPATKGRIILAKDFEVSLATGRKVYLDIGAEQGLKPGDYFRVVRSFSDVQQDDVDALSMRASIADDSQKNPPSFEGDFFRGGAKIRLRDLPRKAVGELIILSVAGNSATAMVTFAREEIKVGDVVEVIQAGQAQ